MTTEVRRGDIWWAELPGPVGHEPGFRRPVVVVQDDLLNGSRLGTTVVVSITSQLRAADAPGNVFLSAKATGLKKDSVVNVTQIATVDLDVLVRRLGGLGRSVMERVDEGLMLVLRLP